MSVEKNKEIIKRFYEEFWQGKNYDIVDELVADNFIDHRPMPGFDDPKEAMKFIGREVHKGFTPISNDLLGPLGEGDKVFAHWKFKGKNTGEYMGQQPNNKEVLFQGIDIFRIENGKIAECWHQENAIDFMIQMGYIDPEKLCCDSEKESCGCN